MRHESFDSVFTEQGSIQLRHHDGTLEYTDDLKQAFQEFHEKNSIWKISWKSPNGKRIRIVKNDVEPNKTYVAGYVEDIIQESLKERKEN
jgi:hypothetical protein